MLEIYARHYETGEVIPTDLVERLLAAANHNQGFLDDGVRCGVAAGFALAHAEL